MMSHPSIFKNNNNYIYCWLDTRTRITCPLPTENWKGRPRSRLESNFFGESNPSSQPNEIVFSYIDIDIDIVRPS
jgi:hypothetical protein